MWSAGDFSSAQALCVYAQPLVEGKRVVVVGDASSRIGPMLVELGARLVHVYDTGARSVEVEITPSRGVTVLELPEKDFDVRDGAFDLAIIPDLSAISDRAALLARIRRIVGREGAVLVAARNPASADAKSSPHAAESAIDYYELYELISLQFESVRMIGQVPFVGVALVELGLEGEDTVVSVDAQLAGDTEPPDFFIALASQNDVSLAPYAIVQLPQVAEPTDAAPVSFGARAAIAESGLRADALALQLDERNSASRELETRATEAMAMAERIAADASRSEEKLESERVRHREQIARYEEEIAGRAARNAVLEGALSAMEEAARDLERRVLAAERAVEDHVERAAVFVIELEDARAAATAAAELNGSALSHEGEVAELEAHLRNRGAHVTELEREIARREQIVLDLLSQLEHASKNGVSAAVHAPSAPTTSPPSDEAHNRLYDENVLLRSKLDALALELARREGELATTAWRVTELDEQLSHARSAPQAGAENLASPSPPSPSAAPAVGGDLRAELDKARDELDMLRRALAQEHEARLR